MTINEGYQEKRTRTPGQMPLEFHWLDARHPRHQMPPHWHMEEELIRVEEGRLELHRDGTPMPLEAGDCALLRGGALHTAKASAQCRYSCLVLDGHALFRESALPEAAALLQEESRRLPAGSPEAQTVERLFALQREKAPAWEFSVVAALWELLGQLKRSPQPAPEPRDAVLHKRIKTVKTALSRIRQNYAEPLTLAELAREAHLSPNYFCRIFREIVGRSPVDYLCNYRLEQAAKQLKDREVSITEAAMACGFNDMAYFTRCFKKRFHTTPRDYRKNC